MANFNLTITNEGAAFLADVIANQGTLNFTEVRFSSTNYVGSEATLTAGTFGGTFITVAPSASILDQTTVNIAASFDNTTFTAAKQLYSIGVIAEDGNSTEYLVAVCTTSAPDTIPAYMAPASNYSFDINMTVSDTENITVTGSVAGALYVSDIVDGLDSYETNKPLSANQGRVLKGMIQSGGLLPHIIITTNTGSIVTLTFDGETITATETSTGEYEADVPKYGTWIITSELNGSIKTVSLVIDIVKIYTVTINHYYTMGLEIDLTDSNPATCCTYTDDAVDMTSGSSDWDSFFGHYPCLFKNGVEVAKLDPNDFTKDIHGNSVDITSGTDGDVMIAFPKRGLKISTSGTTVSIKMTNDPDASGFKEYAHERGSTTKDVFYYGAFMGYYNNTSLRSLSGKTPTASLLLESFRNSAQANGSGYDLIGFYQLIYIQAMYILKYKNLDSQSMIGTGFVKSTNTGVIATGGTETWGMDCEVIKETQPTYMTDQEHHVKLFGIEDLWGNIFECIDGLLGNSSYEILTATENFNNSATGYTNQGSSGFSAYTVNYMSKPQGNSECGFFFKEASGSATTYFCDKNTIYSAASIFWANHGGSWGDGTDAGIFNIYLGRNTTFSSVNAGGRLMYL